MKENKEIGRRSGKSERRKVVRKVSKARYLSDILVDLATLNRKNNHNSPIFHELFSTFLFDILKQVLRAQVCHVSDQSHCNLLFL